METWKDFYERHRVKFNDVVADLNRTVETSHRTDFEVEANEWKAKNGRILTMREFESTNYRTTFDDEYSKDNHGKGYNLPPVKIEPLPAWSDPARARRRRP